MEDQWLLGTVFGIWALLAVLYAVVPMFHMPGSTAVWGTGACIFLVLLLLNRVAYTRHRNK